MLRDQANTRRVPPIPCLMPYIPYVTVCTDCRCLNRHAAASAEGIDQRPVTRRRINTRTQGPQANTSTAWCKHGVFDTHQGSLKTNALIGCGISLLSSSSALPCSTNHQLWPQPGKMPRPMSTILKNLTDPSTRECLHVEVCREPLSPAAATPVKISRASHHQ